MINKIHNANVYYLRIISLQKLNKFAFCRLNTSFNRIIISKCDFEECRTFFFYKLIQRDLYNKSKIRIINTKLIVE